MNKIAFFGIFFCALLFSHNLFAIVGGSGVYVKDYTGVSSCTNPSNTGRLWKMTCNGVLIEGIGECASVGAVSQGTVIDTGLTRKEPSSTNMYCWCRILKPTPSKWVYVNNLTSANNCIEKCTYACQNIGAHVGNVTRNLLNNFI